MLKSWIKFCSRRGRCVRQLKFCRTNGAGCRSTSWTPSQAVGHLRPLLPNYRCVPWRMRRRDKNEWGSDKKRKKTEKRKGTKKFYSRYSGQFSTLHCGSVQNYLVTPGQTRGGALRNHGNCSHGYRSGVSDRHSVAKENTERAQLGNLAWVRPSEGEDPLTTALAHIIRMFEVPCIVAAGRAMEDQNEKAKRYLA